MNKIKGPAIFLAQFISEHAPFNNFKGLCEWASGLGYKAIQVPTSNPDIFDLEKAAQSQQYCDEVTGIATEYGLTISELSTHLQGQLIAVHPAYDEMFDNFAAEHVKGNPAARTKWATEQRLTTK